MKRIFRNYTLITGVFVLMILASCEDEVDAPKSCLEPPCGSIENFATNLTINISNPDDDVTSAIIIIDDVETTISLDGIDKANSKYFTCWQTIPDFTAESVVVVGYTLNGEPIVGGINATLASSDQVVLRISDDAAILLDYEECIDVI